jgi:hypothetical protein
VVLVVVEMVVVEAKFAADLRHKEKEKMIKKLTRIIIFF